MRTPILLTILFSSLLFITANGQLPSILHIKREPSSLLNQFYDLKKNHPDLAKKSLEILLKDYPNNIIALKEMGYWHLQNNNSQKEALPYFQKAYETNPADAHLALQIAYIFDKIGNATAANEYFKKAGQNTNPIISAENNLLDQFYLYKKSNPHQAQKIIQLLMHREPNNSIAFTEAAYLNLALNNKKAALYDFKKVYELKKDDKIALQIGYIADNLKDYTLAKNYFAKAGNSTDLQIKKNASKALIIVTKLSSPLNSKLDYRNYWLNQYYAAQKQKNIIQAEKILHKLLKMDPTNVTVLKEMGYLYLQQHQLDKAKPYILSAFNLTQDYKLAEQLGFIEDGLSNRRAAYYYFKIATHTNDPKTRLESNIAMTNLSGWQTRLFPKPYFADIYLSPFYYSRFDLVVYPIIVRTGVYFGDHDQWETYGTLRYTRDDKSGFQNQLPQIYQDNTAIIAAGVRYRPFISQPLYAYAEFGRAYDLIYRERSRWRGDVRGGMFYINNWGRKITYTDRIQFPFKWVADAYGDSSYYTRFNNNFITVGRLRPGLRLMEYHSSFVDAYFQGDAGVDTNHDFYNNFYEIGSGVLFVPYNRINLGIRFVALRGYYIPVNSSTPNPYGSHYNNKIVLLEYYGRF